MAKSKIARFLLEYSKKNHYFCTQNKVINKL